MAGKGRPKAQLVVARSERETLERWMRRRKTARAGTDHSALCDRTHESGGRTRAERHPPDGRQIAGAVCDAAARSASRRTASGDGAAAERRDH